MSTAKVNKPTAFTGKDLSLAAVNTWIIEVEDYVEDVTDDARKLKIAGSSLSETAKLWYVSAIRLKQPQPTFAAFLVLFRTHFSRADEPHILRNELQQVKQGDRSVLEYQAEFDTIAAQIGPSLDLIWAKGLFEVGLHEEVQKKISHTIKSTDTINDIAASAQRGWDAYLRFKPKSTPSKATRPFASPAPRHAVSTRPRLPSNGPSTPKLSATERAEHFEKGLCFHCHKFGHSASVCKTRIAEVAGGGTVKTPAPTKPFIKREYSDAVEVASESDSDSYYHSAPTIRVPIVVEDTCMDALADSGSSISLISKKAVARGKILTRPSPGRAKAGQAFSRKTVVLDKQVKAHVEIPSKEWTSEGAIPFFVADLAHSDAVLGMNFLKQERVLVDPVAHDVILPTESPLRAREPGSEYRQVSRKRGAKAPVTPAVPTGRPSSNYYAILESVPFPSPPSVVDDSVPWSQVASQDSSSSSKSPVRRKSRQSRKLLRKSVLKAERKRARQLSTVVIDSRRIHSPTGRLPPPPYKSRGMEPVIVQSVDGPLGQPNIAPELAQLLHDEVVSEFKDIFADKLPPRKPSKPGSPRHRIILKDPDKSINGRMFALPEKFLNHMLDFLEEHLAAGRIRPSSSNMAAGTWMIPKEDKTVMPRVVHDYRALNENTVKDHTPIPRQDQILRRLAKSAIRGFVDCPTAYYQMDMEPDDVHKTAFKTPFGMFEWLVMPQGLCNAVGTWQRFMNWVLRKYVGRICYVYFDDIAIFSDSIEEHRRNVRLVLEALREAGVIVSIRKSRLFADKIEFLGHVVSSKGLEVGASKVEKILNWPAPRNVPEVRAFNGLVNYIGEFIPGLAEQSSVLSNLTKKGVEFAWGYPQQRAFQNIKRLVQNTPVCRPIEYDDPDPIFLVADGSNHAIGGYYGQGKDHKTMRPAAFHSRSLNQAERNYPTHDKEMLAIIDCLKKWEHILTGTRFEILTDHAPLTHWKTQKDLSPRQIRWGETLARRRFTNPAESDGSRNGSPAECLSHPDLRFCVLQ
jgi:hypothetical protein